MISYKTLISITAIFFLLSLSFAVLGFYTTDYSLMTIALLFAIAGLLFKAEMKGRLHNPFNEK
ncbi:hypothetical protein [Acinetobacter sp. ANC 4648]|uniref:hypothetical protein n=1 Tax=Acinetobacter sp. ANC 4648 TaxID=1977875 RepID=UPI000A33B39C|nr:hypothetical protein [Acinetobacter sp. ANC 4648]OTG84884.1 hypothetical protein B9T27_01285 [Acinetobacter sp. ANC 4648]